MIEQQHVFKQDNKYFLVDIWENGNVTLKVKEFGWGDTWSLPINKCDHNGKERTVWLISQT